jgi:hypothetical protein
MKTLAPNLENGSKALTWWNNGCRAAASFVDPAPRSLTACSDGAAAINADSTRGAGIALLRDATVEQPLA